jgi:hypothetical protein
MKSSRAIFSALAAIFLAIFVVRATDDPFAWPPITSQTKPWAFNWWMGSAVDKTNLTRELERYAAAGLGGIHIIPIYGANGFEDKYITYLSPKWMEMMGWTVSEAKRLGMGVDMTTGSGWCFGGPQVTDQDANASVVVKTYDLASGERLKERFSRDSTQALVACGPEGKVVELTDRISPEGEVDWTAPDGGSGTGILPVSSSHKSDTAQTETHGQDARATTATASPSHWTIYAISQKPSGQKVKRAGPGGEGWMLNLIYPHAMDDFLKPYTTAFANYNGPKPRAQYHDSYEYKSDWSPVFFAEFEKRRGYKLQTELPALFGTNNDEHSARVLCDYRQTVSEIMAEESLPKWVNWSHEHGFLTRNQAHGSPGNWLDLYACADIPETEMFHLDRNKLISKFASSAAHVTGKPLVSAETGTWLEEHFTEKLSDVKYLFDDMFLSGVNHMFYHGLCYSPDEAGWPGWHFYASLEMNPRNSIWHDVPALNAYAARCQAVLQSGQPDNDILLYYNAADFWMQPGDKLLPQLTVHARDWFEGQPIGRAAKELWDRGYAFDYVSDTQLEAAKVVNGKIQMPGGKYQVIVVPECKYIPLETFKQLLALAQNGALVIFQNNLPEDVSGADGPTKRSAEFKKIKNTIQLETRNTAVGVLGSANFGKGVIFTGDLAPLLKFCEVYRETMTDGGLSFVRRSFDGGWNYFIANRTGTNFDGWITLAHQARSIIALDPMTGKGGMLWPRYENGMSQVHLQLQPGESIIVRTKDTAVSSNIPLWVSRNADVNGVPVALTSPWHIGFISGGPVLPTGVTVTRPGSWTLLKNADAQRFAGTALYTTHFSRPAGNASRWQLDLGDVRQSARVRLNGQDYGTLITPPFRVVVDNLKPTGNVLEVEVTSVAANRIRDLDRRGVPWKTFRDINIVNLNYKPFDASAWPLTDCGLLGPVTLTPVAVK